MNKVDYKSSEEDYRIGLQKCTTTYGR